MNVSRCVVCVLALAAVAACSDSPPPGDGAAAATAYNIDASRISVSGISSGAYMATQLHVAHSALFGGAALVAGGPFYCAGGSLSKATGPCLAGGDIDIDELVTHARGMADAGDIDALSNLAGDSVWIFHGALDDIVSAELSDAAAKFYRRLVTTGQVASVDDIEVVHGWPTLATGAGCDEFASPFINACDYDAAGQLLAAIHGELQPRARAAGELVSIPQPGAGDAGMLEEALLYVPATCAAGEACGVHVAIHGCTQSSEFVGAAFAAGAGINEWAESNHLLVLYPQVAKSRLAPMNPYGCWDWWGYTGDDYATRSGAQIRVIRQMLDGLAGTPL